MPLTFKTAFPRLSAVKPFMTLSPGLAWADELDWEDGAAIEEFARIVIDREAFTAKRDLDWLDDVANAAVDDLNDLQPDPSDEQATRSILFLRFLFTVIPMETAFSHGRRGASYDWAFRGMSPGYDPTFRRNDGYVFLPLQQPGDPLVAGYAMRWIPRWCHGFFLMARDAELNKRVPAKFAACWEVLKGLLRSNGPGNEDLRTEIFFAFGAIASWAVHEDDEPADDWVRELVDAWEAGIIPERAASVVASAFITRAHTVTGRTVREWALEVLGRFGNTLREHERLQFLVATIDTRERWRELRSELLREIDELNQRASEADEVGGNALFAREARLDVVKPLIVLLVKEHDLAGAMDILSAWYRAPGTEACDDDVLLIHPAFGDGVAALWPGGTWIDTSTPLDGHHTVVAALDEALGFQTDADAPAIHDEEREGMPIYALGVAVEAAMMSHYRPDALSASLKRMKDPRSLVVFPSVSDPLQALMARELGMTLPLEVSLAKAEEWRQVRSISIWAGSTYFTHFEVAAIKAFAAINGWHAEVFPDSVDGDAHDFRQFYGQPGFDVLWVAGHGKFVAHRPDETGIVVCSPRADRIDGANDDVTLPMAEVATFDVPGPGRRLLVLNTCNGATTQGMAGMARIGLAQSLVGARQSVIGHLWPASSALALAFGALLASNLDGRGVLHAFAETLRDLRDPETIVSLIEQRLGNDFAGAFKLRSDMPDLASIMAWGCPVLLT